MALTESLILRKPRSGCLEERTALIHPMVNTLTRSHVGIREFGVRSERPLDSLFRGNAETNSTNE